ncbi:hypothetical protein JCM10207_003607 [Rhodosporidiobolus poonsookiae]
MPLTVTVVWQPRDETRPKHKIHGLLTDNLPNWTRQGRVILQPVAESESDAKRFNDAQNKHVMFETAYFSRRSIYPPSLALAGWDYPAHTPEGFNTKEARAFQDRFAPMERTKPHATNAWRWHWDAPDCGFGKKRMQRPLEYFYTAKEGELSPSPRDEYIELIVHPCIVNSHAPQKRREGETAQPFQPV